MRKVILSAAVSLDGLIEGPNGEYDWCFVDQDYGMKEFMESIDAIFIGRKSYEMVQGVETESFEMPPVQEYVSSTTLDNVKEGSILLKGDLKKEVEKIKNLEGKNIWLFGGHRLPLR